MIRHMPFDFGRTRAAVRPTLRATVIAALLCAAPALAEKKVELVFSGDNGGEIAPCG